MKQKFVLTGGGTAGHVYPTLAVAEKLDECKLDYIGGNGMEKEILKNFKSITYHEIPTVKFERKFTFKNLLIPFKLIKSVHITKKILKKLNPDAIFSKGGFVSVPVVLAAKKLKIPVISHESDLSLGLANRIILKKCDKMCTTFEETISKNKKAVHTGQPIREKIFRGKKQRFFNNNKENLLVLGGSLGAKFINEIIFSHLNEICKHFNVLHITGKKNYQKTEHDGYFCVPYAENIEDFYASSDIVLARAGSGVINELLALQKPMLLIPLSKKCSRGDQIENAKNFKSHGYADYLEEEEYSWQKLLKRLLTMSKNKDRYVKNMQKSQANHASEKIANMLIEIAKRKNCE